MSIHEKRDTVREDVSEGRGFHLSFEIDGSPIEGHALDKKICHHDIHDVPPFVPRKAIENVLPRTSHFGMISPNVSRPL